MTLLTSPVLSLAMSLYSSYTPAILSMQFPEDSVQFSRSVVSDSLRSHGLQHARLPCPSTTPGTYSNSCPLNWWCHPTILSSVVPFSSCLQSFPASESFPMSQLFAWGELTFFQWVNSSNEYSGLISFRIDWASLIARLVKNSPAMQETLVWFLGLSGRSPGEGKGHLLQYSGLEKSMDCIVHGVAKSQTWPSNFHLLSFIRWLTENIRRYAPEGDCSLLFSLWLSLVLSLLSICLLVSLHPSLQEFINVFPLHRVPFLLLLSTFITFTSVYPFGFSLDVTSTGLVLFFPHSSAKLGFPSTYFHSILLLHL